jgi:outer membrane protein assembly factor BamB
MRKRMLWTAVFAVTLGGAWLSAQQPQAEPRGFQGTGGLAGVAEEIPAPPMKVRWKYKTSDEDRASVVSSPVIAGDRAYVADAKGVLHAINLKSGKADWTYPTPDGFETTPLIYDGKVYLGDMAGKFHCVNITDGKKVWVIDAESSIHSSANVHDGRIVFGTDGAEIFCLNAADGKEAWRARAGDRVNAAPAIGNGLAYVSGCDAQLRAIDMASGQEKFAADLGALAPGSAVLVKDRVVVGTDNGRVVCMSADGKKTHWVYDQVDAKAMVYASPAVADGVVVVGARDRQVHAIDLETGRQLWTLKTRGDVDGSPLISAGRAYVGSKDKKLYVIDLKSGQKLWEYTMGRGIEAGPAIAQGVLVAADSGGNVVCLEAQ